MNSIASLTPYLTLCVVAATAKIIVTAQHVANHATRDSRTAAKFFRLLVLASEGSNVVITKVMVSKTTTATFSVRTTTTPSIPCVSKDRP